MHDILNISSLSLESIYQKLERVDKALSKLNSADSSYLLLNLSKDDLFDIFMALRQQLVTQLATLGEHAADEELSHDSLGYTYQTKAMRNSIEHRI